MKLIQTETDGEFTNVLAGTVVLQVNKGFTIVNSDGNAILIVDAINGDNYISGSLSPAASSAGALGTPSRAWQSIFLAPSSVDPHIAGLVWNNAGVLTLSEG